MWRRTLAVAAVLAMTFALAPHQPGLAQPDPEEQVDEAQDDAEDARPAQWSARKVSIAENYADHRTSGNDPDQTTVLWDVEFATENVGYAIGEYASGDDKPRFLLRTKNGGTSWSSVAKKLDSHHDEHHISFPAENVGYIPVGNKGLHKTVNGGASFTKSLTEHSLGVQVAFVTPELGWTIGKWDCSACDAPFDVDIRQLLMTTDGGTTWEARSAADPSAAHVISTDGGQTWQEKTGEPDGDGKFPEKVDSTGTDAELQAVGGPAVEDVVLYLTSPYDGKVRRSEDAGASWTDLKIQDEQDGGIEINDDIRALHAVDEDTVFVVGTGTGNQYDVPVVARTTDGGDTWEDVTPDLVRNVPDGADAPDADAPPPEIELHDIAVAWDPNDPDGDRLVAHVVGTAAKTLRALPAYPVAFTTTNAHEDAAEVEWDPEPVDLSAFPDWRVNANTSGGTSADMTLRGVASTPFTDEDDDGNKVIGLHSVAVGDNFAIVGRTTDPPEPDPQAAEAACLPPGLVELADDQAHQAGTDEGQIAGAVEQVEGTVEDTAGVPPPSVICEPLKEPVQAPADEPAFTPKPAEPCDVHNPEAVPTSGDHDDPAAHPELPVACIGEAEIRDESGGNLLIFKVLGYDEALGRVVLANGSESGEARVAMFDPVDMVQRGVEGFGDGFGGDSVWGHHTGAVNLADVDADVPDTTYAGNRAALMPIDPEERRHSVAMVGCPSTAPGDSKNCIPGTVVTVSLTGQFTPKVAHTFDTVEIEGQPHVATKVVHLTYDRVNRVLYALTEYNAQQSLFYAFGDIPASMFEPQTVLHALDADPDGGEPGELRPMWSTSIEQSCKRARHSDMRNMAVSPDGRALVFGCQGADSPHWGHVAFTPHGFMRVGLPDGVDPGEMGQADTGRITQRFYALPAQLGTGSTGHMFFEADARTGLVFWNIPRHVTRVFDFAADRWIGSFQTRDASGPVDTGSVAADPDTGRLYINTAEDVLRIGETINLPVSLRRPVDLATDMPRALVIPGTHRVVTGAGETRALRVFEDRVPPAAHLGVDDPDADTNDIDEDEAASVLRNGRARGYGSRVWWSGLHTASPGLDAAISGESVGNRVATWSWLFTPEDEPIPTGSCNAKPPVGESPVCHGYFTSRMPGMASSTQREAMFGRVSTAELTASSDVKESEAVAASQGVDDDSQEDVRRRRLLSEWRRYVDDTVLGPWDDDDGDRFDEGRDQMFGHEGWRQFERCADEGIDRLWRELDGERRVSPPIDEDGNQPEDCFAQFDEDDPRGADRSSAMEATGAVAASRCHDENTGNPRERKARGAEVDCDAAGERTAASAELGGFTLRSPEGQQPAGWLTVGSSTSDATVVRDADEGIVVESTAAARDIEMGIVGQGKVRIGEVRAVAKSWAKGRPDTADSWLDIAYEDVQITDEPDGKVRFSCGRAQDGAPATPDGDLHRDDDDTDGAHAACDPHAVVDAINLALGNRLQATTPARDTADKIEGSPRGARAIVRRDPSAYWSDFVINNFSRWEIPALQLTFFNDSGAGPNRLLVDLAGVFTEANYVIGQPLGAYDSGGGTDDGDGDFDPGPATVTVELTDTDGTALAGGQFGLTDHTGAPTGTCTTDDSGACDITGLPAGDYQVSQLSSPAGYLPADDTAPLTLAAGGHATVTFANVWAAGGVTILLTDPAEEPLADGAFDLLVGDGDGNATVFDTCTTGDDGTCAFPDVPLGDVAVRQTATPDGYQPAEPVAFALTSPGQVARLHVINGPAGAGTSGTRGQVVDDPMPQTERISLASSPPAFTGGTQPEVAEPDGLLGRALVLPGQVAQFALRNPGQALLFTLVWLLVGAPLYLAVRRRELNHIKQWS